MTFDIERGAMSERKLYEIGLRVIGVLVMLRALGHFSGALMYVFMGTSRDLYYEVGRTAAGLAFLFYFAASILLLSLAPRIAKLFSPEDNSPDPLPVIAPGIILPIGLILIGVMQLASGLAGIAEQLPSLLEWARFDSSYPVSHPYSVGEVLAPTASFVIGLLLIFHGKVFPKLRSGWEAVTPSAETSAEEHPSEGPDNQDPQADE